MNKKLICIGITSMFLLTSFPIFAVADNENSNAPVSVSYSFTKPVVKQVEIADEAYNQLVMEDCPCVGNPGEPNLPARGAYILLPQGTNVNKITVNTGEKVCLGSGYIIEPVGNPVPLSMISSKTSSIPDETIYSSTDLFPGNFFTKVGIYDFRGYKILVLMLHPVQYIPASGELFYYPELMVSVETVEDENANVFFRGLEKDHASVLKKVDNPIVANTYSDKISSQPYVYENNYDLLIITTDDFKDDFEPLKQIHDKTGVNTVIKTLSEIGNTPTDIRNYIRNAYMNLGVDYVLLGGDSDIVPVQSLYFGYYERTGHENGPSDLYYSCLDGTFNYDGDNRWGEPTDGDDGGDVDLIAEVYVGRACVGNSDEVHNFLCKTIRYIFTDPNDDYLKKVLMAGTYAGFGNESDWGGNFLDELINSCNNHGYSTIGIPSSKYVIDTLYDRDWEENGWFDPRNPFLIGGWSREDIIKKINDNVHIINNVGHGSSISAMKLVYNEIEYVLKNDKYPFVYSIACEAGSFDNKISDDLFDCFAEYLTVKINHGAFAAVMNARMGFGNYSSTDSPSQRYQREFWDAVFGEDISVISGANQDSKEDNIWRINDLMMRWICYGLNLFGDPTVDLFNHYSYQNHQPEKPDMPSGSSKIKPYTKYTYSTNAIDSDFDQLWYIWDWGDGCKSDWMGPYNSGETVEVSYSWKDDYDGSKYNIRVKAKDVYCIESEWSDPLSVSMPKSKSIGPLANLLERLFRPLIFEKIYSLR